MTAGLRKLILALHIGVSVGWLGAVLAYLPLDVATAASNDAQTLRTAYFGMELIARWVILPLSLAALATGIWIGLTTPWGLFRHYWVLISLILTTLAVVVLLVEMRTIGELATIAKDASTSEEALRALPSTLPHSVGGVVVLAGVMALNIYKPRGLTRYGWRKRHDGGGGERQPPR
jgi:hypothetical protein